MYGIATTAAIGFVINLLTSMFRTSKPKHPLFFLPEGSKVPVCFWLLSAVCSGTIYPSIYAMALYYTGSEGRADWARGSDSRHLASSGQDLMYLKYFLYVFFGYLARDLPHCLTNMLFTAHHVLCMAGIISTLETTSPGAVAGVHGILVLELGSFFFNVWSTDSIMRSHPTYFPWWPRYLSESFISLAYYVMLSLSNVIAGYFLYHSTMASFEEGYVAYGCWSAIAGLPLLIIRQLEVNKAWSGETKKPGVDSKESD